MMPVPPFPRPPFPTSPAFVSFKPPFLAVVPGKERGTRRPGTLTMRWCRLALRRTTSASGSTSRGSKAKTKRLVFCDSLFWFLLPWCRGGRVVVVVSLHYYNSTCKAHGETLLGAAVQSSTSTAINWRLEIRTENLNSVKKKERNAPRYGNPNRKI